MGKEKEWVKARFVISWRHAREREVREVVIKLRERLVNDLIVRHLLSLHLSCNQDDYFISQFITLLSPHNVAYIL